MVISIYRGRKSKPKITDSVKAKNENSRFLEISYCDISICADAQAGLSIC